MQSSVPLPLPQSNSDFQRALDSMIARRGREATLSRTQGNSTISATFLVFMRGYTASELVEGSGITQGDSTVVISSTYLAASGWTGGDPRSGDRLNVRGKNHNVQSANIRPTDVGWNLHVKG